MSFTAESDHTAFRASFAEAAPRRDAQRLRARRRALIEERLARECDVLAEGLAGLRDVIERAVGTEGRGGGRWRPLLTLTAADACGGRPEDAMDAAIAVELTHTASLVLDDLPCMDDSAERRGLPATHRLVGSAGAILLSVGLLARAAELIGRRPDIGGALASDWGRMFGLAGMAGGQAMDVAAKDPLRGSARRLHRAKSTVLPAFALGAGARAASAPACVREGLEAFGRGLGWAYQLLDDIDDAAEDARQGRKCPSRRPASHSERIMRSGYRRLHGLSGLREDAVDDLVALAGEVVPIPGRAPFRLERDTGGRGAR